MKKERIGSSICVTAICVTILAFAGMTAQAACEFDISFSGPNDRGSGTLTATPNGDGTYTVLGGLFLVDPFSAPNALDGIYTVLGGSFTENAQGSQSSTTCDLVLIIADRHGRPVPVFPSATIDGTVQPEIRINSGTASPTGFGILSADPQYSIDAPAGSGPNDGTRIELWAENGQAWLAASGPRINEREQGVVSMDILAVPEPASTATYAGVSALGLLGLVTLRQKLWRHFVRTRLPCPQSIPSRGV